MMNELRTDERGRFYGKGERRQAHTADSAVFPVEHENELFSRAVTDYLDEGGNQHRYSQLYLIAAPKFPGLVRSNFDKEVQKMVTEELAKDISKYTAQQIEEYVKQKMN